MGVPRGSVGILWSTRRNCALRLAHLPASYAQALERLRRSDLMDQMQIDGTVEQRQLSRGHTNHVLVHRSVKECELLGHGFLG